VTKSRKAYPAADDIDLATLGRALWRAKGWILGLALGVGAVTFIGLSMVRPLYTSEARILIQNDESAFTRPASERNPEQPTALDEQAVQSQVQVLTSRDLTLQVVKDLDLTNNPAFAKDAGVTLLKRLLNRFGLGRGTPQSEAEKAANALADHLEVYQLSKSSVIAIDYTSSDPSLAAQVANKLADVYIAWQREAKIAQTKDATAWLKDQIDVLRKQVASSEEAVEKFRASEGLYAGTNNVTLSAQQLSELNSQLILADAQKSEAEARARLIKQMLADKGDIDATPEVLKSQLIINLIAQRVEVQRRLAELSATLLPSHPRIQQLKSELADVRQQIRDEANKIVRSLESEAQVAAAREASLRASLNTAKTQSSGLSDSEIKLRALEREAKANRDLLDSYLARYRDASARHDMGAVPAQAAIVSRAHASVLPSFPKRGPITLLVMAATALLALAYVLARELISGTAEAGYPMRQNEPRLKPRRTHTPQPATAPPVAPPKPSPQPRPAASVPPMPPPAAAAPKPGAASSSPMARKLPVVIPVPQAEPAKAPQQAQASQASASQASASPASLETAGPAAAPPPWHAKEPPQRPSWLQVKAPRRAKTVAETPATAPHQAPKSEPQAPQSEPPVPGAKAPAPAAKAPPAATGLLDRLRQEFSAGAGETSPGAPKSEARLASGFLDRFRRSRSETKGSSVASTAKPAPTGVEMSALSPNDLRHYLTQRIAAASSDADDDMGLPPAPKIGNGRVGPVLHALDAVLNHVFASAKGGPPRALLVAGVSAKADATQAAIGLARALVAKQEQVVLVDLARGASAVSGPLGMPRAPGFTDLAAGRASFGDVVRVDDETALQVITAGNPVVKSEGHEPDRFMRVFKALTQAYDCVVLHADLGTVRMLMPALKFELPVMVAVLPQGASVDSEDEALSTFQTLGCPVLVYGAGGKQRRARFFGRTAAM
jgi:tyrosine-protein kinase Etk/Wzc